MPRLLPSSSFTVTLFFLWSFVDVATCLGWGTLYVPSSAKFCATKQDFCPADLIFGARTEISLELGSERMVELTINKTRLLQDVEVNFFTPDLEFIFPPSSTTPTKTAEIGLDKTIIYNILHGRQGMLFRNTLGNNGTDPVSCATLIRGTVAIIRNRLNYCDGSVFKLVS